MSAPGFLISRKTFDKFDLHPGVHRVDRFFCGILQATLQFRFAAQNQQPMICWMQSSCGLNGSGNIQPKRDTGDTRLSMSTFGENLWCRAEDNRNTGKDGVTMLQCELHCGDIDGHYQIRWLSSVLGLEKFNPASQVIRVLVPYQIQVLDLDIERFRQPCRECTTNSTIPICVNRRQRAMCVEDDDLLCRSRAVLLGKARRGQTTDRPGDGEKGITPASPAMQLD